MILSIDPKLKRVKGVVPYANSLHNLIENYLYKIGMQEQMSERVLHICGYSEAVCATYNRNNYVITLFIVEFPRPFRFYSRQHLLYHFIHEITHHVIESAPDFVRLKRMVHTPAFWKQFESFLNVAIAQHYIEGGDSNVGAL